MTPEEFLAGHPEAYVVYVRVRELLDRVGPYEVRASKSQLAFRRRRGFAYLWRPAQYLRRPASEVALSVVLGRRDDSPRWKEVVQPSPHHWMHHLVVEGVDELDAEVEAWLREAATRAG